MNRKDPLPKKTCNLNNSANGEVGPVDSRDQWVGWWERAREKNSDPAQKKEKKRTNKLKENPKTKPQGLWRA